LGVARHDEVLAAFLDATLAAPNRRLAVSRCEAGDLWTSRSSEQFYTDFRDRLCRNFAPLHIKFEIHNVRSHLMMASLKASKPWSASDISVLEQTLDQGYLIELIAQYLMRDAEDVREKRKALLVGSIRLSTAWPSI
jgi:hypothetical protein